VNQLTEAGVLRVFPNEIRAFECLLAYAHDNVFHQPNMLQLLLCKKQVDFIHLCKKSTNGVVATYLDGESLQTSLVCLSNTGETAKPWKREHSTPPAHKGESEHQMSIKIRLVRQYRVSVR
jgi:hypothetical protein